MDWNHDGRIDAHDYAHYKSAIDTGSSSLGTASYSSGSTGAKWFVAIIIVYVIIKICGT